MNKVIVLIPVYKNIPGLLKTLESLRQEIAFIGFDVLIVDDSPVPELCNIDLSIYPFKTYLIINKRNIGITDSLNKGLRWIRKRSNYLLIARLDAGDEAVNRRLLRQVEFMDTHPKCVVLGGAIEYVTVKGDSLYEFHPPTDDRRLRAKMHINNYICHPAAMMRSDAVYLVGGYRQTYPAAEDYDLFWRLAKVGLIANLAEVIIHYEVSNLQISFKKRKRQLVSRLLIQLENFRCLCLESYWGIAKSILGFILPWHFIIYIKSFLRRL